MSLRLRKVPTASGATAVQIVTKRHGKLTVIEHLGSAHTPAQLAALEEAGREKINESTGQLALDLDTGSNVSTTSRRRVKGSTSRLLIDTIHTAYNRLGFDVVDDNAFFQLVLARLVEPTSKSDSIRVLNELGAETKHRNTFSACLKRVIDDDYRSMIAGKCFDYSVATTGISLILYDVTTLYFEAEKEDSLRKVGYSKERRVDPQIVVGLLVDRTGFPLEIGCFEGNKAETFTMIPIVKGFQDRHGVTDMVIVADAGMLSAANLKAIDDAGLRFIVGSRQTKAPNDLATFFTWNGTNTDDGQLVDTLTPRTTVGLDKNRTLTRAEPVWSPVKHPKAWRAVWQYRRKRAVRDRETLNLQRNRAMRIIDGESKPKAARFVKIKGSQKVFDESSYDKAVGLAGWKGYVTNIERRVMTAREVVGSYHDLWHVEQSFRMSKTALRARPIFHRTRDAIEAHLTVVFTALAVARFMQEATGLSLQKIITTLRPLREFVGEIDGHELVFPPDVPPQAAELVSNVENSGPGAGH
ncbi:MULTISPECIES: IS1634 family transposase [Brevibacterium]|uniref:Mobile element protein n=4 Tax=Brevibacterium TaxID=1696 RepID=A0A1D7VYQ9_BREAU|nr:MULTISPECIES: IS1634 family transposase [Brevibacterium]AOP51891.1 Mobile element protein [Brevibacterium aurantiacum]AZL11543.1 IS1634 family transposase [Brevibacterium aurantiacum]KAB1942486.1 IS1634 family transposase [Brevibacterium linens ATCC 9172]RCS94275.1 IS1634 family transposase [Brevibacterium aurantiacum]SMY01913.1 Transposase DDE domain-containing protein [Brevibacterium linens ATCC 9172]